MSFSERNRHRRYRIAEKLISLAELWDRRRFDDLIYDWNQQRQNEQTSPDDLLADTARQIAGLPSGEKNEETQ